MHNAQFHSHFIHRLLSVLSSVQYQARYLIAASHFSLTAWFRSWTILRAFAPGEWKKRMAFIGITCCACIGTAAALLTLL